MIFTISIRVDVKRRLNAPYQREQSQLEKLRRALKPEEFAAAMVNITDRWLIGLYWTYKFYMTIVLW